MVMRRNSAHRYREILDGRSSRVSAGWRWKTGTASDPSVQQAAQERERQLAELKAARESGVLVQGRTASLPPTVPDAAGTPTPTPTPAASSALDPDRDPNAQGRKAQFVGTLDRSDATTERGAGGASSSSPPGATRWWFAYLSLPTLPCATRQHVGRCQIDGRCLLDFMGGMPHMLEAAAGILPGLVSNFAKAGVAWYDAHAASLADGYDRAP